MLSLLEKLVSVQNIITRLKCDQYISIGSIERLCIALSCGVDDILEFTK